MPSGVRHALDAAIDAATRPWHAIGYITGSALASLLLWALGRRLTP